MFDLTLTFDNGPDLVATPEVLTILERYGVLTTFFAVGCRLALPGGRDVAEQAALAGHWIGNHTYTHTKTLGQFEDPADSVAELSMTQGVIGNLAHPDRLVRPFADGGFLDKRVLSREAFEYLQDEAFTMVLWHAVPRDWEPGWVDRAMIQLQMRPWTLMVIHDGVDFSVNELDRFLGLVVEAGGRFRQDFPDDCVMLRRGKVQHDVEHLVADEPVVRSAPLGHGDSWWAVHGTETRNDA